MCVCVRYRAKKENSESTQRNQSRERNSELCHAYTSICGAAGIIQKPRRCRTTVCLLLHICKHSAIIFIFLDVGHFVRPPHMQTAEKQGAGHQKKVPNWSMQINRFALCTANAKQCTNWKIEDGNLRTTQNSQFTGIRTWHLWYNWLPRAAQNTLRATD